MPKKLPRCKIKRCNKIARHCGYCKSHATKAADTKFSLAIRAEGQCYGQTSFWIGPTFACAGPLHCAHLFSRRYRNVRWDVRNAVPLCAGHHKWFDTHPIEKDDMMLEYLEIEYADLHDKALEIGDWWESLEEILYEEDEDD